MVCARTSPSVVTQDVRLVRQKLATTASWCTPALQRRSTSTREAVPMTSLTKTGAAVELMMCASYLTPRMIRPRETQAGSSVDPFQVSSSMNRWLSLRNKTSEIPLMACADLGAQLARLVESRGWRASFRAKTDGPLLLDATPLKMTEHHFCWGLSTWRRPRGFQVSSAKP